MHKHLLRADPELCKPHGWPLATWAEEGSRARSSRSSPPQEHQHTPFIFEMPFLLSHDHLLVLLGACCGQQRCLFNK